MTHADGSDMTDEQKLADYVRMKSIYNRLLQGVDSGPEEVQFQRDLKALWSGMPSSALMTRVLDHINAYRARIEHLEELLRDWVESTTDPHCAEPLDESLEALGGEV